MTSRPGSSKSAGKSATTRDAFFRGRFEALQPAGYGHRSGSDALLLAASLPQDAKGRMADLGAGVGVASFAALTANPGLSAALFEIDPAMIELARASLDLPANAHLSGRAEAILADVALSGERREQAGLANAAFDYLIMNPPFNHDRQRPSPDEVRRLAHQMGEGGIDSWLRTAAAILKPGGTLCLIWRTERLADILAASQGRFGGLAVLALHARANEPASRIIVRAVRGSRAPLSILPGVVLHEPDGCQSKEADALLNGRARLALPA